MINTISNLESAASIRETLNQMVAVVNYYSASQFGGSTTTTTQSPFQTTTTTQYIGPPTTTTTQYIGPPTTTTTAAAGTTSTTTSGVITLTVWDGSIASAQGLSTSMMACSTINQGYSHTVYLQPGQFHQYNGQPVPGDSLFSDISKTMVLPANYYGYYFTSGPSNQYLQVGSNGVIQNRANC